MKNKAFVLCPSGPKDHVVRAGASPPDFPSPVGVCTPDGDRLTGRTGCKSAPLRELRSERDDTLPAEPL